MMVTVDGGVFEALLSNMVPGKMYQVTVSSVKGLEESDPSTDTVTTGWRSSFPTQQLLTSGSGLKAVFVLCFFLFVSPSFGQTAGSDCGQRDRHHCPVALATGCGYC